MNPADELQRGLEALGIPLPEQVRARLLAYCELLAKWNRTHNLTAVREAGEMVRRHLLDSLAVLPHLGCDSLADVGSGGGLPGIPLAIARPGWRVALIESSHKKASFLRQACIELGLANVEVVCERVESWRPRVPYACVISRAFSDIAEFLRASAHLATPDGTFAAMKGVYPHEELAQLPEGFALGRAVSLDIPGLDGARHLVILRRRA